MYTTGSLFCNTAHQDVKTLIFLTYFPGGQVRRKLLSILDSISLSQTYPEAIQLEFFDPSAVDRLIEQKSAGGGFCHVKVLHKSLMTELNNIQGATAGIGQRQVIVGVSVV